MCGTTGWHAVFCGKVKVIADEIELLDSTVCTKVKLNRGFMCCYCSCCGPSVSHHALEEFL